LVNNKIIEYYQDQINRQNIDEDNSTESDYINNHLQLIEKEIEPHSKNFFQIVSRDLQLGNIGIGGGVVMTTLEGYHRSLTYTKEMKQKLPNSYEDTYEIVDPNFDIESIDWTDHEQVKKVPKIMVKQKIVFHPIKVKRIYKDIKTNKIIEKEEEIKEIDILKEHILDSPLERSAHFIVLSNSFGGFLRRRRGTISREVNAKSTDSIEAGKPIIMKNNSSRDYNNYGGGF